tara:strand:- start:4413 stop:6032 length:1620 start_codon:yes stop_codon:yes gene_type:complete
MADTFSNDLRLRLQESGSNAGTWGDLLNGTITNIASALGQGSEAIPNASTHTITLADGVADEARSLYLKCTGGGQACTVTLGPNTISKVWIIDNETAHTLTFKQGNNSSQSGTEVAIGAGAVKVIVTNGAGVNSVVTDALFGLEGALSSLAVSGAVTATGLTSSGPINLTAGALAAAGNAGLSHRSADNKVYLQSGTGGFNILDDQQNTHFSIDSAGVSTFNNNVGIGTSAPSNKLDIKGTVGFEATNSTNKWLAYHYTDNTLRFNHNGAGADELVIDSSGNVGVVGKINCNGLHNSLGSDFGSQQSFWAESNGQTNQAGFQINWYTGGNNSRTFKMKLDNLGNLLVNTTSNINFSGVVASHNFSHTTNNRWVSGFRNATTGSAWGIAINYSAASPNSTSNNFLFLTDSSALRCSVMSNGGVQNYQANDLNLSDRREKTNFLPAKSYLNVICAIPVQTFNYIDQNMEEDPSVTLGVVAQDVQTVAPELVTESNWGTHEDPKMRLSIYQTDFQYALMKSIQEQQATIEALTQRIETLENN